VILPSNLALPNWEYQNLSMHCNCALVWLNGHRHPELRPGETSSLWGCIVMVNCVGSPGTWSMVGS
jgi:hypothetical protein